MGKLFVETVAIDGICEIIIHEGLTCKTCIVQWNAAFLLSSDLLRECME